MLNFINRLSDTINDIIAGLEANARSCRLVQRAIAVGALIGCITLLGPIFGYEPMALFGVVIMLVANPEKTECS